MTGRIKLIDERIREIEDALDQDLNVDAALIASFNDLTGKTYEKYYFQNYL